MARILKLPDHGRLIVCTDLQGCLRDYQAIVEIFEKTMRETGDAHLLFTGDLVHGPCYPRDNWPEHLGDYYPDQSVELIEAFEALQREFPGRVFSLIGNHEHSHIGGPHTRKFHKIPSETEHFERSLGPRRTKQFKELVARHRKNADMEKVAEGDHWTAQESMELGLGLVDEIGTSAEYLFNLNMDRNLVYIDEKESRFNLNLMKLVTGTVDHVIARISERTSRIS